MMHDLDRMSSSLSLRQEAEEIRDVDSKVLRRDALNVVEDEDNDGDADESVAFVVLRSSAQRIFEYSSVLIRTFRDDRIPFNESVGDTLLLPVLAFARPCDVVDEVAGPPARDV